MSGQKLEGELVANADVTQRHPLVAFIGATQAAIPPATIAFAEQFPEATLWNLVDDRLIVEAVAAGGLTEDLGERMARLVRYAVDAGAEGILLTCSMYGPVAHQLAPEVAVPVYASDDAAFEDVLGAGYARVILLSSLPEALRDAEGRFAEFARGRAGAPQVIGVLAEDAFAAAAEGRSAAVAEALAEAVQAERGFGAASIGGADAILLAQYSLAPAAAELERRTGLPVIAGPPRAAVRMRAALLGDASR